MNAEAQHEFDWDDLIFCEFLACAVTWFFWLLHVFGPAVVLHIPLLGLAIPSRLILPLAASVVPGLTAAVLSKESRRSIFRLRAGVHIYLMALLVGLVLPFAAALGDWPSSGGVNLLFTTLRVFLINILLAPLWEEVLWRGFFLPKVYFVSRKHSALLLAALLWTIWHFGYLFFLYKSGFKTAILLLLLVQYFAAGVVLNCIFQLAEGALLPCVLFHASFNAAVAAYHGFYGPILSVRSYVAETVAILVAGTIFFVTTKNHRISLVRDGDASQPGSTSIIQDQEVGHRR